MNMGLRAKIIGGSNEIEIEKSTLDMTGCKTLVKNKGTDAEMTLADNKFEMKNGKVTLDGDIAKYESCNEESTEQSSLLQKSADDQEVQTGAVQELQTGPVDIKGVNGEPAAEVAAITNETIIEQLTTATATWARIIEVKASDIAKVEKMLIEDKVESGFDRTLKTLGWIRFILLIIGFILLILFSVLAKILSHQTYEYYSLWMLILWCLIFSGQIFTLPSKKSLKSYNYFRFIWKQHSSCYKLPFVIIYDIGYFLMPYIATTIFGLQIISI